MKRKLEFIEQHHWRYKPEIKPKQKGIAFAMPLLFW
jgi:hypothetical protein